MPDKVGRHYEERSHDTIPPGSRRSARDDETWAISVPLW
jgi:hypothetical protein